jgi:hypothetical protein
MLLLLPGPAGDCYFGASAKAWFVMLKSFGYHMAAADTKGVNLFFVHESAAGKRPLLSLDDAKRLFIGGGEFIMLNVHPCTRMVWVQVDEGTDFASADFSVNQLPLVMLGHKPAGSRHDHRVFYPVKHVDVMFKQVGGVTAPKEQGRTTQGVLRGAVAEQQELHSGSSIGTSDGWTVFSVVIAAFMAGGLCHRYGNVLFAGKPQHRISSSKLPLVQAQYHRA